jgi:hypothetical protein
MKLKTRHPISKLKTRLRENNIINNCASTNKLCHLCLPGLRKAATQIIKGYYAWHWARWKLGYVIIAIVVIIVLFTLFFSVNLYKKFTGQIDSCVCFWSYYFVRMFNHQILPYKFFMA